jgi:two-component system repressor protein LuxO
MVNGPGPAGGAGVGVPPARPRVLLVEDQPDLAWTYRQFLADEAIDLDHVATAGAALARLDESPPAVMVLDLRLPDMDGFDVLRRTMARGAPTAIIVITAYGDVDVAVEAMRRGACDFLAKPLTPDRLRASLASVLDRQRRSGLLTLPRRSHYHGLIGGSPQMQTLYQTIENVSQSRAPVFVTGESGVGKELCAHAIHAAGPRLTRPFVALNCAAIPRDLVES